MKKFIAYCKGCGATEFDVKRKIYSYKANLWKRIISREGFPGYGDNLYCPTCKIMLSLGDIEYKEVN